MDDSIGSRCSVIVLTMGDRDDDLTQLVDSLADAGDFQGVLVGNGVTPKSFPGWKSLSTETNIGISAGRALGADAADGDVLVFIDDDAANRTPGLVDSIIEAFDADAKLGALALRVCVSGTDDTLSEWQPRVLGRNDTRTGPVTTFVGNAHAIRASAYHRVGGYLPNLFYAHEETDIAWRLQDDGWTIHYRPDLTLEHPFTKPSRHSRHLWYSARNRVWLAHRHLPLPVAIAYMGVWSTIQALRCRSLGEFRDVVGGTVAGLDTGDLDRRPIKWSTIWAMTRAGRPPII